MKFLSPNEAFKAVWISAYKLGIERRTHNCISLPTKDHIGSINHRMHSKKRLTEVFVVVFGEGERGIQMAHLLSSAFLPPECYEMLECFHSLLGLERDAMNVEG